MREGLLKGLLLNVSAGTRLVFLLPVRWQNFRAGTWPFVVLVAFNLCVWAACASLQADGGALNPAAIAAYLAQICLLLLACLAIAAIHGNAPLALLLAVILSSGDTAFELAGLAVFGEGMSLQAQLGAWLAFVTWSAIVALRGVVVCMGFHWRRLAGSMLVIAALMALSFIVLPRPELWTPTGQAEPAELAQEELFHAQGELIEASLAGIEAGRPGVTELYFVGFAPDGSQDVFRREMQSVSRILDRRYATEPRSVVLISNPATLDESPIATATNLRRTLRQVGERMNPQEDVLFLYITAHGDARFQLSAYAPPLDLAVVNPTVLLRALNDSGIKWRVLVISACYAGGFIEPLKDDNTLIITAAAADRQSFGCENGNDWTYFGEAYFKDALSRTGSFVDAFALASRSVAAREAAEHLSPPSNPRMFAGPAIAEKLRQLKPVSGG